MVILHYMKNTTNTIMTHVPMCHTCGQAEVAGPFTTADGEGFCSASCEAKAQAEFAAWAVEFFDFGPVRQDGLAN